MQYFFLFLLSRGFPNWVGSLAWRLLRLMNEKEMSAKRFWRRNVSANIFLANGQFGESVFNFIIYLVLLIVAIINFNFWQDIPTYRVCVLKSYNCMCYLRKWHETNVFNIHRKINYKKTTYRKQIFNYKHSKQI